MSRSELDALLRPRAVAFIGISPDPMKYSGRALQFLRRHGFTGPVYPVNPKYDEILGERCLKDASELPAGEVDLAFISLGSDRVVTAINTCAARRVRAAIVISSGFAEAGDEGAARQAALAAAAARHRIRVCGPNCVGVANVHDGIVVSFATAFERPALRPGNIGIVSQSGAFSTILIDSVLARGLGLSYVVSSGNEADLKSADYLDYLVEDARTKVILVYLEGLRDAERFLAVARRALERGKPIVLLKTGRSEPSRRAILSHSGSLAGEERAESAAFARAGVVSVPSLEAMLEVAMLLSRSGATDLRARSVGVVCIGSGGATGLAADLLDAARLSVPTLSVTARERLRDVLPPFVTPQNPLDVAGYSFDDEARIAGEALEILADEPFDALLAILPGLPHVDQCVEAVLRVREKHDKPLLTVLCGGPYTERGVARLTESPVAWSRDLERACRALSAASDYWTSRARALRPRSVPAQRARGSLPAGRTVLTERESKRILKAAGLCVSREVLVATAEEAVAAARALGFPVALKVQSPDLSHKSDIGGVVLDVRGEDDLRAEFARLRACVETRAPGATVHGYLVQEMITGGVEVFLGVRIDAEMGPVIAVGPGGVFVEVLERVAVDVGPIDRADAEALIDATPLGRLLRGVRGRPPAHRGAVVDAICNLATFAEQCRDQVQEIDVNPLIALGDRAIVVDALIVLRRDQARSRGERGSSD